MGKRVEDLQDEICILEYRAGDLEALARLISRWQTRIHFYIRATLGDVDAVWDISQETWLAVVRELRRRTEIRSFRAWLYRVSHNKCMSYLRRKRLLVQADDVFEAVDAGSGNPGQAAASAEDSQLVHEALLVLPLTQREAVTLYYLEDLSTAEIAEILDVPVGTVQSRLHHGRAKLKETLSRKGYGHE